MTCKKSMVAVVLLLCIILSSFSCFGYVLSENPSYYKTYTQSGAYDYCMYDVDMGRGVFVTIPYSQYSLYNTSPYSMSDLRTGSSPMPYAIYTEPYGSSLTLGAVDGNVSSHIKYLENIGAIITGYKEQLIPKNMLSGRLYPVKYENYLDAVSISWDIDGIHHYATFDNSYMRGFYFDFAYTNDLENYNEVIYFLNNGFGVGNGQ